MKNTTTPKRKLAGLHKLALMFAFTTALAGEAVAQNPCTTVSSIGINTGFNYATSTLVPLNTADPSWDITALTPTCAAMVGSTVPYDATTPAATLWPVLSSPNSRWISFMPGTYTTPGNLADTMLYGATFTRQFRTCTNDNFNFNLNIAFDNFYTSITVDGVAMPAGGPFFGQAANLTTTNYTSWTAINFSRFLTAGTHTISITVHNYPQNASANPHGLNVEGTISSAASLPSLVSNTSPANCSCAPPCNPNFTWCFSSTNPYQATFTAANIVSSGVYQWTVNGSLVGSGPNFSYTFPTAGTYTVCLNFRDSKTGARCEKCVRICIAPNEVTPVEDVPTGRKAAPVGSAASLGIDKVYPNPTSSELNIEFSATEAGSVAVKVYDLMGKLMLQQNSSTSQGMQKVSIDTRDLANGVYILELSDGVHTAKQKIVKE